MKEGEMKEYKISTFATGTQLIYLTKAKDIRTAINNLVVNSVDFKSEIRPKEKSIILWVERVK